MSELAASVYMLAIIPPTKRKHEDAREKKSWSIWWSLPLGPIDVVLKNIKLKIETKTKNIWWSLPLGPIEVVLSPNRSQSCSSLSVQMTILGVSISGRNDILLDLMVSNWFFTCSRCTAPNHSPISSEAKPEKLELGFLNKKTDVKCYRLVIMNSRHWYD